MTAAADALVDNPAVQDWLTCGPAKLREEVASGAIGPAGDPVETWLGQVGKRDGGGDNPILWRIGSAALPGARNNGWPVAVELLDRAHLAIATEDATRGTGEAMAEQLVMRVLSTYRPGLVRIHVWDIREHAGSMPGLYPLLRAELLTVWHPAQLCGLLDHLSERITLVRTRILKDHGHRTLAEHAAAETEGVRTEPWTVAVLLGDGEPLRDADAERLQRVSRGALDAGISLITVDVPVEPQAPYEAVILDGEFNWCTMSGEHARLTPDLPASLRQMSKASQTIATAYLDWLYREASFRDLLPGEWGGQSSAAGLVAPVGFDAENNPVTVELGDATPHALVAGPTGAGKTNLIMGWLMAMATRYPPRELRLYLLDFKDSVSFIKFGGSEWLPHAALVGANINEDREFGLALLRHLREELQRRAKAMKRHGVDKLADLRRADPDGNWPRIVAVIDEFQVLFEARFSDVVKEATTLMTDLARRGRSFGIHLVLASQIIHDIQAFWACPGIFQQFQLRIALPRSHGLMANDNHEAMTLPKWHAIVNTAGGQRHGNQICRIPNASTPGTADEALRQLHNTWADQSERPILLDGNARVPADSLHPIVEPSVLLGRAFTVDGAPAAAILDQRPGRNMVVIGEGASEAPRVLSCAAVGLSRQGVPLDLVAFEDAGCNHARWVAAHAEAPTHIYGRDGHPTEDDFPPLLSELLGELKARRDGAPRPTRAVVIYEVDAIAARASQATIANLQTVIHRGPEVGVHVLGWWRRPTLITGGKATSDDFGVYAVGDTIGSDLRGLIPDGLARFWQPRDRRFWLFDRRQAARGRQLFVVPNLGDPALDGDGDD